MLENAFPHCRDRRQKMRMHERHGSQKPTRQTGGSIGKFWNLCYLISTVWCILSRHFRFLLNHDQVPMLRLLGSELNFSAYSHTLLLPSTSICGPVQNMFCQLMPIVWLSTRSAWAEIVKPRFLPQILVFLRPWFSGCIGRVLRSLPMAAFFDLTCDMQSSQLLCKGLFWVFCHCMILELVMCTGERSLLPYFGRIHSRGFYRCTHESWQGRSIWIMPWGSPEFS